METHSILAELEKERKELEKEFIQLGKEIKICKDSEERKNLQNLKKEIQFDLDDIKIQIEELQNETNEKNIINNQTEEKNETISN
jgi:hypothetical protein